MKCSYVSCRRNSPNLSGVQLRSLKSAKSDSWSSRQEKSTTTYTTFVTLPCSKGFVTKPAKMLYSLSHKFFVLKINCQLWTGTLVWSSVELGKGELGVVLYGRQNVSDLMFKKKLLLLITELVVILKNLDKLHDQLCDPQPPHSICKNEQ